MTGLPAPEPRREPGAEGYWASTASGRLAVARCARCERTFWHPRPRCPACTSPDVEYAAVSGDGVVYSHTVNRRPAGAYKGLDSVVVAYVELAEGPRILTNLVGAGVDGVRVGTAVRAVVDHSPTGAGLVRFRIR